MNTWTLFDRRQSLEGDDDGPIVQYQDDADLRDKLLALAGEYPGFFILMCSTRKKFLKIGLSSHFGFLHWTDKDESGFALAEPVESSSPILFQSEGAGDEHMPEELIPIRDVVEAIVHCIHNGDRSPRITWRMWSFSDHKWKCSQAIS